MVNCLFDSLIMYSHVQCIVPNSSCYNFVHILILFNHHVLIFYYVLLQFMCLPGRHGNLLMSLLNCTQFNFRLIEGAYCLHCSHDKRILLSKKNDKRILGDIDLIIIFEDST